MSEDTEALEKPMREACQARDYERATTLALERYSGEVLGFLAARMRAESDANEVFSIFVEDLWRGLPAFEWRCSLRGWCYALARNAANRYARSPQNRRGHNLTFSKHAALSDLVERARTTTRAYAKSEVKDRMRELRERLPEEDQTLLVLRVDRGLPWKDLVLVMQDSEPTDETSTLDKSTASLRKRFERIKLRLREMAKQEGLI